MSGATIGTIAACIMAAIALAGLTKQWFDDHQIEERQQKADEQQQKVREADLDAVVTERLKALLVHYDGVFEEYERRARELTGQLGTTRKENSDLRARVAELEDRVTELQAEIATLRAHSG